MRKWKRTFCVTKLDILDRIWGNSCDPFILDILPAKQYDINELRGKGKVI